MNLGHELVVRLGERDSVVTSLTLYWVHLFLTVTELSHLFLQVQSSGVASELCGRRFPDFCITQL